MGKWNISEILSWQSYEDKTVIKGPLQIVSISEKIILLISWLPFNSQVQQVYLF